MTKKVCILDYGSGNVRSVFNLMSLISSNVIISNDPKDILEASHLILPGVGAFGSSMKKILDHIPILLLKDQVFVKKTPFLGICVGMQVLADTGYEFGQHAGLGWISGETIKIDSGNLPLPHIGWNTVDLKQPTKLIPIIDQDTDFYFVHSYAFSPKDKKSIISTTEYGKNFCSMVQQDNIMGVQFHPEKSQQAGRSLLNNFLSL